tara:strand:- start:16 stop:243 length:228 start_codon:yes stop_codon:yes gene_type:complete
MKELVEYIAKSIVSHPEEVRVTEEKVDGRVILRLEVATEDKGKVIGREGRVAQSVRVLIRIAAIKAGLRASLEIV